MNVQILPQTQSWTPGSDLWVTALPEQSAWSRRMDWHLNFQITKGNSGSLPERSEALEKLLTEIRWQLPKSKDWNSDPLLIAAGNSLPAKWVLVLSDLNPESISASLKKLTKIWNDFNRPKMRLFLPSDLNHEAIRKSWNSADLPQDFELVLE